MKIRRLAAVGIVIGVVLAASTACLQPNQHTLVGISASHRAGSGIDAVVFTFDQGVPAGATLGFSHTAPSGPSGKPVGVDGSAFIRVDLTPAVAHDARGVPTAPAAFYPVRLFGTTNVLEVAQVEDFEGHVGYAIGLRSPDRPINMTIARTGTTIAVNISALG